MRKLNLAIIGQGRSGKDIHGTYYRSAQNLYYDVRYIVEEDEGRRRKAAEDYPLATVLSDYSELFGKSDIDLVVNCTYSFMHYEITKRLLNHGFNVLVEKPFARNQFECGELINLAKSKGVTLAVFQQTFYAPFYRHILKLVEEKTLGEIVQVNIRYNALARRWDWQTLQKKMGGNAYNTGPHPFGIALGILGFDPDTKVAFTRLKNTELFSGDADSYCKVILDTPNKPVVDIEINNTDAYSGYNVKLQGTKGSFKCTPSAYELKYVKTEENPERPVVETFLHDGTGKPIYCSENLVCHEESAKYDGTAFDAGTRGLYEDLYFAITEGRKMFVTAEMAQKIISVIEIAHAQNYLPSKF